MIKYKQLWIRLKDYNLIRKYFPAQYGETLVRYFERLAKWIKEKK